MPDIWDQFPDAPSATKAEAQDPWAAFPDAPSASGSDPNEAPARRVDDGGAPLRITVRPEGAEQPSPADNQGAVGSAEAPGEVTPQRSGVALNTTAGVNEVIYGTVGAPVDAATWMLNKGIGGVNAVAGTGIPEIEDPIGGSRSIAKTFGAVGVPDPESVQATTPGEQVARGAGQGVGSVVTAPLLAAPVRAAGRVVGGLTEAVGKLFGSTGQAGRTVSTTADTIAGTMMPRVAAPAATEAGMALRAGGEIAKESIIGAVAGGTGSIAEQIAPEPLKPLANMAGNIVGGMGAATVVPVAAGVRSGVREVADYIEPMTETGQRRMAVRSIDERSSDPVALRESLDTNRGEIVPGSKPTTFQQTGDMGLGGLERDVERRNVDLFTTRRADQNIARRDAVDGVQRQGAPEVVSAALRQRLSAISAQADADVGKALDEAAQRAQAMGRTLTPEEAGSTIRAGIERQNAVVEAHESALWEAVDPGRKLTLPMPATREAALGIVQDRPRLAAPLGGTEAGVLDDVLSFAVSNDMVVPFRELAALRSRLSSALREARSTPGQEQVYRRLSILRGAVENDIDNAVQNIAARQADAVAKGTMREDETIAAKLQRQTDDWYARRDAESAGRDDQGNIAVGSGVGSAAPFAASRATGKGWGGPASAPRDQGLQSPEPLVPVFDEGAAERLKAASAVTKQKYETFDRGAVGNVLARPMSTGPYNVPDSLVAQSFLVPGTNGFQRIRELRAAIGDDAALKALEDYAVTDLQRAAMHKDGDLVGALDPRKTAAWVMRYSQALRAFPELNNRLGSAKSATETLERVVAERRELLDREQKGALGTLMRVDTPESATAIVGGLFGRQDAREQLRSLKARVAGNPDAEQGLRKSVAEYISRQFVSNVEGATTDTRMLRADQFQTFVRKNGAALGEVFSADEVKLLQAVADDLTRANRSIASTRIPGGSDTYQNMVNGISGRIEGGKRSYLGMILTAAGSGGAVGSFFGPGYGTVAGLLGAHTANLLRQNGLRTVDAIVTDAMLNPERMRLLLTQVTPTRAKSMASERDWGRFYGKSMTLPGSAGAMIDLSAHNAATSPQNDLPEPTDPQKEAGNFKMGHVRIGGLDISIEHPEGSERKGTDRDGNPWSVTMKSHYGYIRRTTGKDGDQVDVFVAPGTADLSADDTVFVIDQKKPNGQFDEHKVMLGFKTGREARAAYDANYARGWKGFKDITPMKLDELKGWLDSGVKGPASSARAAVTAVGNYPLRPVQRSDGTSIMVRSDQWASGTGRALPVFDPETGKRKLPDAMRSELRERGGAVAP